MKQNVGFLILIAILSPNLAICCGEYFSFGYIDCSFHVIYKDQGCKYYDFNYCTGKKCNYSEFDKKKDRLSCNQMQTFNYTDYGACLAQCCNEKVPYKPTVGRKQCQVAFAKQNNDIESILYIAFISSSFLALSLFVCLCWAYFRDGRIDICIDTFKNCVAYFCCCRWLRQNMPNNINDLNEQQPRPGLRSQSQIQLQQLAEQVIEIVWQVKEGAEQRKAQECPICLEKGVSFQLQCGHLFHRDCFVKWAKIKGQCVLCRMKKLTTVRVYCQKCFSSNFEVPFMRYHRNLSQNIQICQHCKGQEPIIYMHEI